jgi:hypothetical protein
MVGFPVLSKVRPFALVGVMAGLRMRWNRLLSFARPRDSQDPGHKRRIPKQAAPGRV